ncbi:MAG TPA: helix-turn-helix domain-containing protein [Mycobacteriales bacterium]
MSLGRDYAGQECALASALELIGERWTLLLVRDAFYGVRRYSDFLAHVGAPRAVLAERLQSLVDAGVFERRPYQDSPPRDEYVLTEMGVALWPAVYTLAQWGERYLSSAGPRRIFAHVTCGSPLDPLGMCSSCGMVVAPADVEVRPGPGTSGDGHGNAVSQALRLPHRLLQPLLPPG